MSPRISHIPEMYYANVEWGIPRHGKDEVSEKTRKANRSIRKLVIEKPAFYGYSYLQFDRGPIEVPFLVSKYTDAQYRLSYLTRNDRSD